MKKLSLFLTGLLLFTLVNNIDKQSFVGYSWPPELIAHCQKSTTVFFVSYPSGIIIGAGVLISPTGQVLSAAHLFVHDKLPQIKMLLSNGNAYDMKLLAINERTDLALVEPLASAQKFDYALIQQSSHLYVGEDVLVIGHPFEAYYTVTSGIISRLPWSLDRLTKIIETDAVINPGNSGGPMFNTQGEVIGIVSAKYMNIFGPTGIGIAVHLDDIHQFLKEYNDLHIESHQIKRHQLKEVR